MNKQTESMIKEAEIIEIKKDNCFYIFYSYEHTNYYLTINNDFIDYRACLLKFKYELDAKTYLAVLKDNLT